MSKLVKWLIIAAGVCAVIAFVSAYGVVWYSQARYKGGTGAGIPLLTAFIFTCLALAAIASAIAVADDEKRERQEQERERIRAEVEEGFSK